MPFTSGGLTSRVLEPSMDCPGCRVEYSKPVAPRLALLDHPCVMAALATAVGAGMGLARADWQWAVEIAQTASGIVPHSPESVPAIVAASLWSVVTQALAVALRLGLSEAVLSMALSAVGTGMAVLVLSMLAYASSRRTLVAIGAALLVIEYGWTDASFNDGDVGYPIYIFPTPHTY